MPEHEKKQIPGALSDTLIVQRIEPNGKVIAVDEDGNETAYRLAIYEDSGDITGLLVVKESAL